MHFHRQRDILLTLQERRSRLALARRLLSKDADLAAEAITAELGGLPTRARRTITHDNGGEFARHQAVTDAIGLAAYFCDPHSPWQRGSIENANGRLRRDLPRKIALTEYTDADIDDVIWNLTLPLRSASDTARPSRHSLLTSVSHLKCESSPLQRTRTNRERACPAPIESLTPSAERWPSGRRRAPAKGVGGEPSRGFESLPLRHLHIANPKTGPSRGLFLYVPKGFAGTIRPSETGRLRDIGLRTPTISFHPPFALGETDSKSPYISVN